MLRPRRNRWPSGARIVLRAAEPDRPPNLQVAAEFGLLSAHGRLYGETGFSNKGWPVCKTHRVRGRPPRVSPLGTD